MINKFDGTEYRFLSNFYPCTHVYEGITYPTTEHSFQAAKTLDTDLRQAIAELKHPNDAKRAGRSVPLRADWDVIKAQVMLDILRIKFWQPFFRDKLLDTGSEELIEGNTWHDNFFGICGCGNCPPNKRQPPEKQNHLGRLLMIVRDELNGSNAIQKLYEEMGDDPNNLNLILEEIYRVKKIINKINNE